MAIYKDINLTFEEFRIEVESNNESDMIIIRLIDYVLDKKKSTILNKVYKPGKKMEVYATTEDIKEIIKSLGEILPQEESETINLKEEEQ